MEAHLVARLALVALLLCAGPTGAQIRSLYSDVRARQTGDLITVILVESAQAQRESRWANSSEAVLEGSGALQGGALPSSAAGLNASAKSSAQNQNQSAQRELLRGTLSARVIGTDAQGNLLIEGQRMIEINGERHLMRLRGFVRLLDVRADNTVLSTQIADAQITYKRAGLVHRFAQPGLWTRVLLGVLVGVAAYKVLPQLVPQSSGGGSGNP
ncbi:MAG: flagellar basal body L-ring protein FlgH [Bacteroidota bacterium]|nr:flagellar basal body L-ring protein FlgH [Rhodothermia bacterium]MDW8286262.1 flagellar basal body L-ring protein FlgH [Bacteroidota bacterium]